MCHTLTLTPKIIIVHNSAMHNVKIKPRILCGNISVTTTIGTVARPAATIKNKIETQISGVTLNDEIWVVPRNLV